MKMKKKILTTVLLGCLFNGSALAEKVTYDKAVADSNAYQESLPNYENATSGLSPAESSSTGTPNQMGKWVNLGGVSLASAGAYTTMLTPNALNTSCIKGEKGFVPKKTTKTERVCTWWQGTGSDESNAQVCQHWETKVTHSYHDNGYKAECR
ncbi:hypothetical protein [uncultured Aliivibrio sp.]|uniref:hypothetical protein n=1 Tax=uncultured Aliivibrio sp. TaxID=873085 RepID=UPI002628C42C|nr:hypothetical protein [uncultured Aliivibrio sp.]